MYILTLALIALFPDPNVEPKDTSVKPREITFSKKVVVRLKGNVLKPTRVGNVEESKKALPETAHSELIKQIDFKKEDALVFLWTGSGGDRLSMMEMKTKTGTELVFTFKGGLTDDFRWHFKVFAVPKKMNYRVQR